MHAKYTQNLGGAAYAHSRPIAIVNDCRSPVSAVHHATFGKLADLLGKPKIGSKDGKAWVPADIAPGPRTGERVESVSFLVLDVEADAEPVKDEDDNPLKDRHGDIIKRVTGPEPPGVDEMLAELGLHGWRCILHTSYSHGGAILPEGVEHPRYRLAFDLSRPLQPDEIRPLGLHMAVLLGIGDCIDTGCLEPARLFYAPRCPEDRLSLFRHGVIEGEPLPVDELLAEARQDEAAAKASPKRTGQSGSVIAAFNATHEIGPILEQHGYRRKGRNRWLWQESTTGLPGVRRLPDSVPERVYSSHTGDPLADGNAHDAFDCWRILNHGGDLTNAVREAARMLGPERPANAGGKNNPEEESESNDGSISLFDGDGKKKSQATLLIELASQWEVFHDAENVAYIVLIRNGVREVWPIRSTGFRQWLTGAFFVLTGKGCNSNAVSDALITIEARAVHQGKESPVYLRVARVGERIYLDLCDEGWRVLEISPAGWKILDESPVNFVRKRGMAPLPAPAHGGLVADLRDFLNIGDGHFELVVGWILGALRGRAPFPVLVLQGEQGTGKSTTSRVLRTFVDPSTVPLRTPPREVRDLLVSAVNNHLVVLDNLSGLSPEFSDCLCRFATGGGLDVRALFTDMDQVLVDIQRPVLVNGIDDIATRPDLSERSIILNLPVIDATKRKDERSFWAEFEAAKPGIMGALLDALAHALAHESRTQLERKPRMADFAIWVTAAEPALKWESGAFIKHFDRMQDKAVEDGIEASPVGSTLLELLGGSGEWTGTPTALLSELTSRAGGLAKSKAWPMSTKGLKNILNRLAPSLRCLGITIEQDKSGNRLYKIVKVSKYPPEPPQPPETAQNAGSGPADSPADSEGTADNRRDMADNRPGPADRKCHPPYSKPSSGAGSGGCGGYGGYSGPYVNAVDDEEVF